MVSNGQAFAYRKYLAACDGTAYLAAENQVQHLKREKDHSQLCARPLQA
jgi:hypothetical protein